MPKLLSEIKTLFSENFACFRKFWVYQFVISLLGVMVTLPLSAFISLHPEIGIFPYVIALIFSGGMFCFLIYYTMFEQGARDYIRVKAHKAEAEPLKGLWICLIAYIPTILIAFLDVIFALCGWGGGYTGDSCAVFRIYVSVPDITRLYRRFYLACFCAVFRISRVLACITR